ncbi:unnamed protein product [Symbiodinium microadriaticum]|nr:unnamed protein product [Symbiodinium microadriaticum]
METCVELRSDYPEYLELRQYLGNFSTHRNLPCFTISKTSFGEDIGRPLPRTKTSADHLAPGHYPVDRDFPTKRRYEAKCQKRSLLLPSSLLPGPDTGGPIWLADEDLDMLERAGVGRDSR